MGPARDEHVHDRRERRVGADPDGELLGRVANRDPAAFDTLYRRYARPVYALALRRLSDPARAEDATRRAFAAIRRSASSYVPESSGGTWWLFTVARNAILDHAGTRSPAQAGAASSEDGWMRFRVHAAVAGLPEHERVPLELAYWDGRSEREIAELLELPLGTVESRTRSALARLAAHLEDSADGAP